MNFFAVYILILTLASTSHAVVSSEQNKSFSFIWGTESTAYIKTNPKTERSHEQNIINDTLKVKYVKLRLQINHVRKDGTLTPNICMPSHSNCFARFDLDKTAELFKKNGWSMLPMLSHNTQMQLNSNNINTVITDYIQFVDWFLTRYQKTANIQYIELTNDPNAYWHKNGGTDSQLLLLTNKTYQHIKTKFPSILIGTPGFEYWMDTDSQDQSIRRVEFFLDKKNGALFDFWAFHGYPGISAAGFLSNEPERKKASYPPTKTGEKNKYLGVSGIAQIRKKMNSNGWTDRLIIDTEHINLSIPGPLTFEQEEDDAAYTVQELLLKLALIENGKPTLSGIFPFKIIPRGIQGEQGYASLSPNGATSPPIEAAARFIEMVRNLKHESHISGSFDNDKEVWVEKFVKDKKHVYIFFKPFIYNPRSRPMRDQRVIQYNFTFPSKPKSIALIDLNGKEEKLSSQTSLRLKAQNDPQYLVVNYAE